MNMSRNKLWQLSSTHWMSKTNIYDVFSGIRKRCLLPSNRSYHNYWWRGIKCLWNNFEEFYNDMWQTYKPWLSIERVNNEWDYCRENCRWATMKEQQNNRRNNHIVIFNWEKNTLQQWSDKLWIKRSVLARRLNRWWTVEESFTRIVWIKKKYCKRLKN